MREFTKPQGLVEAASRMKTLVSEIEEIASQLREKNRKNADGKRMTTEEYAEWRKSANFALSCKIHEFRFLKQWETREIGAEKTTERALQEDDSVIMLAYKTMRNLGFKLSWDIGVENQEAVDLVQFHLLKKDIIV